MRLVERYTTHAVIKRLHATCRTSPPGGKEVSALKCINHTQVFLLLPDLLGEGPFHVVGCTGLRHDINTYRSLDSKIEEACVLPTESSCLAVDNDPFWANPGDAAFMNRFEIESGWLDVHVGRVLVLLRRSPFGGVCAESSEELHVQ